MAITSQITKRLPVPHEAGEWVEVRMPSLRMLHELSKYEDSYEGMVQLIARCVVAWSYTVEVTVENCWELDAETAGFIGKAINPSAEAAEEKNS